MTDKKGKSKSYGKKQMQVRFVLRTNMAHLRHNNKGVPKVGHPDHRTLVRRDDDFAEVGCAFHVLEGGWGFGERED